MHLSFTLRLSLAALLLAFCSLSQGQETRRSRQLRVMEYNVENLFDCVHDSLKDDTDFTPEGSYRWTHGRYWRKLNQVARGIVLASTYDEKLVVPDLIGLCEVENDSVVFDLCHRSLLRGAGYEYMVTNSPDVRGIDVALLYQPVSFRPISHYSLRTVPLPGMRPTRDILYVRGETLSGELHVFVVHAPSRFGGERVSRPNRMAVAERLCQSLDSLVSAVPEARVVVMGDFNDYSSSPALRLLAAHGLTDVTSSPYFTPSRKIGGTYRYRGLWGSLDHILVSAPLLSAFSSTTIASHPELLERDETYGGVRPFRFFRGPTMHGGFSDHLPLTSVFCF